MPVGARRRSDTRSSIKDEPQLKTAKESPKPMLAKVLTPSDRINQSSEPSGGQTSEDKHEEDWYEKRREENLKANAQFLAKLNINETKSAVSGSVKSKGAKKPKKVAAVSRGLKTRVLREREPEVVREYGLRPRRGQVADYYEDDEIVSRPSYRPSLKVDRPKSIPTKRGIGAVSKVVSKEEVTTELEYVRQNVTPELRFSDNLTNQETCDLKSLTDRVMKDSGELSCGYTDKRSLDEFVSACSNMHISEKLVAKVTPSRIFSIAMHTSQHDSPLIAAGDKNGFVGLWNVLQEEKEDSSTDDGVYLFHPHTRPVNCAQFSDYDAHILHTASYDGTVRRCDIDKQMFTLSHSTPVDDDIGMMYLSNVDPNTVAVCTTDGHVTYIDHRNHHLQQRSYNLDTEASSRNASKFKSISHHPTEKQYFITGSVQGYVELWDSRYLTTTDTSNIPVHSMPTSKGVLSAYFSPITGNRILACSAGDQISVYNSSDMSNITEHKTFHHNNWTGRWLSNFRAEWHPAREDCLIIGAMKHPRQVELFDCSGSLLHTFQDGGEYLGSVTSLNVMHPSKPYLAGANSSGKVYVFMSN